MTEYVLENVASQSKKVIVTPTANLNLETRPLNTSVGVKLKWFANLDFRREKALNLALKYNFVTDLTSLVVTKPESNQVVSKQVEIVSLDKDGSSYADINPNFSAGNVPQSDDSEPEDIESVYDDPDPQPPSITSSGSKNPMSSGNCKIVLYTKTYLRGESKTLTSEARNLEDFDEKTTSLEVKGPCCWILYSEADFNGDNKKFRAGKFKSSSDMDNLFRAVSSVQKLDQC